MIELVIPKQFPTHGEGYGKLHERDFIKKKEKEILWKRQHNLCALCKKQMLTTQKIDVSHIISKNKGGQLYDKSPRFPQAAFPQACLCHHTCNLDMGWQIGLWQAQVAGYYGFDVGGLDIEKITEKARSKWIKERLRPKLYPFWLFTEEGTPIFLTDGHFDEQAYFERQIRTWEPFVEQEDGALVPKGLGKSNFPEIKKP